MCRILTGDYDQYSRKVKKFSLFQRNCKRTIIFPCLSKLLQKNFLPRLKILYEPCSWASILFVTIACSLGIIWFTKSMPSLCLQISKRVPMKEQNNDNVPDKIAAINAWQDYSKNNNSVIVDLFQGCFMINTSFQLTVSFLKFLKIC